MFGGEAFELVEMNPVFVDDEDRVVLFSSLR